MHHYIFCYLYNNAKTVLIINTRKIHNLTLFPPAHTWQWSTIASGSFHETIKLLEYRENRHKESEQMILLFHCNVGDPLIYNLKGCVGETSFPQQTPPRRHSSHTQLITCFISPNTPP
jgi:hypothetical protein